MHIQNVDKLKAWLKRKLEPICEADPVPLSKYVVALVKKEKSEDELKKICTAQLEVFLVSETEGFIAELFNAIAAQSYLGQDERTTGDGTPTPTHVVNAQDTPPDHPQPSGTPWEGQPGGEQPSLQQQQLPPTDADMSALRDETVSSMKNSEGPKRAPEMAGDDTEKEHRRSRRSRSRSRSHSPGRRRRSRDDDRFRRRDDRYDRHSVRYHSDRDRDRERYSSYRGRGQSRGYRNNKDRSYGDRRDNRRFDDRRDAESGGGRHRSRSRTRSPSPPRSPVSSSSAVNSIIPIVGGGDGGDQCGSKPAIRDRCRDYDEKGFCMRGECCPFDHGNDPVVVEDVNLPKILNQPAQPAPPSTHAPPTHPPPTQPPPSLQPPQLPGGGGPPAMPPSVPPPGPFHNPYRPPGPPHQQLGMPIHALGMPPNSLRGSFPLLPPPRGPPPPMPQPPPPMPQPPPPMTQPPPMSQGPPPMQGGLRPPLGMPPMQLVPMMQGRPPPPLPVSIRGPMLQTGPPVWPERLKISRFPGNPERNDMRSQPPPPGISLPLGNQGPPSLGFRPEHPPGLPRRQPPPPHLDQPKQQQQQYPNPHPRVNVPTRPPHPQRLSDMQQQQRRQQPAEAYNPENPGLDAKPYYIPRGIRSQSGNNRTLIGVPTVPLADRKDIEELEEEVRNLDNSVSNRTVLVHCPGSAAGQPTPAEASDSRTVVASRDAPSFGLKRPREPDDASVGSMSSASPTPSKMVPDSTRKVVAGGWRPKTKVTPDSRTLEIKKIPRELNSIAKLNEHFQKFGVINNLQIQHGGQPDAALVTYANHLQARAAHNSIEAVLNNRFIKVFWHNGNDGQESSDATSSQSSTSQGPPGANSKLSIKDRLGIPTKDQLTLVKNQPEGPRVVVKGSSTTLCKTVYNPAVLKSQAAALAASQTSLLASRKVAAAQEAVRRKHEEQQRQMKRKQMEIGKQKQDLVAKLIQQQKSFLEMLDDKSLSSEKRAEILGYIKKLDVQVGKTKKALEMKPPPKTKTEVQKELLDTELELYNQQSDGGDATELYKRVAQLKREISARNASLTYMNAQAVARGKTRGRGAGHGRARRLSHSSTSIDKRTRVLNISGFHPDDKDEILTQFSDMGEIENVIFDEALVKYTIGFKTRQEAEYAAKRGGTFRDRPLQLEWYTPQQGIAQGVEEVVDHDVVGEDVILVAGGEDLEDDEEVDDLNGDDLLLEDEEEDDEDAESRGWRR